MLTSPKIADALDVRREPAATRDLYGMTLFGQSCLAARRLVEAGTRFVSVFWDEYGLAGDAWDTHFNHFPRMIDQLLPNFDLAYSGLILDLERRGLLDDTLVLCLSEHGRTPKLANVAGGGRDHWSRAYSAVFAEAVSLAAAWSARRTPSRETSKIGPCRPRTCWPPPTICSASTLGPGCRTARDVRSACSPMMPSRSPK
jgi:hypothetical protein